METVDYTFDSELQQIEPLSLETFDPIYAKEPFLNTQSDSTLFRKK